MDRTPNHICKNPKCAKGDDGGQKHYWACNDCDKRNSWQKAACDEECYLEYMDAIAISRGTKVVAPSVEQVSLFDAPVTEPVEVVVTSDPKSGGNTPFSGYYGKKNKHR